MGTEYESLLSGAASSPADSAAWCVLQDWMRERDDPAWCAVSFVRRIGLSFTDDPDLPGEHQWIDDRCVSDLCGQLPRWWLYRSVGVVVDRFPAARAEWCFRAYRKAFYRGEVPPMFLVAHGYPLPEAYASGFLVVNSPGGLSGESASRVCEDIDRVSDEGSGVLVLPQGWTAKWVPRGPYAEVELRQVDVNATGATASLPDIVFDESATPDWNQQLSVLLNSPGLGLVDIQGGAASADTLAEAVFGKRDDD